MLCAVRDWPHPAVHRAAAGSSADNASWDASWDDESGLAVGSCPSCHGCSGPRARGSRSLRPPTQATLPAGSCAAGRRESEFLLLTLGFFLPLLLTRAHAPCSRERRIHCLVLPRLGADITSERQAGSYPYLGRSAMIPGEDKCILNGPQGGP